MALAGLESGLRRPEDRVFSTGKFHIPGQQRGYRDAHGGGGWVDLHKSIAASVNYYYYKLAYDMGIDKLAAYMYRYGFGEPTGIDLTGETAGIVPSREWKAKHPPQPRYPGDTGISRTAPGSWVATTLKWDKGTAPLAADPL